MRGKWFLVVCCIYIFGIVLDIKLISKILQYDTRVSRREQYRKVNAVIDHHGIPLVPKAMIQYDLALNINGCWEIIELFLLLQSMIHRYSMELAGVLVQ